ARAGYLELSMRYGGPGSNNRRIPHSVREMAENLNIRPPTAQKPVFKKLKEHGFILETKRGRYRKKRNYASGWCMAQFNCDVSGELPTHAYKHWQGSAQPISTKDFVHRAQSMMSDPA